MQALAQQYPATIEAEFDSAAWTPLAYTDPESGGDIVLMERPGEGSLTAVMARVTIQGADAVRVHGVLNTSDPALRKTYDKEMSEMAVVEVVDEDTSVVHFIYNSPSMVVSKRDFVVLRGNSTTEGGVRKHWGHSVPDDTVCPTKGVVRGFSRTMYRISPKGPESCTVEYVQMVDPRGWIPTALVNSQKTGVGARLAGLRAVFKK